MKCHYCEKNESEGNCDQCGEPVCIDCCVVMTLQNQIDYPLCLGCDDDNNEDRHREAHAEWERQERIKAKKAKIAAVRKKAYWKPEAVEKRRLRKIKRQKERKELREKQMAETVKAVSSMFKGMF